MNEEQREITLNEAKEHLKFCIEEMRHVLKTHIKITVVLRDTENLSRTIVLTEGDESLSEALKALSYIVERRPQA